MKKNSVILFLVLILFQTSGTFLLYLFILNTNSIHIRKTLFKDEKNLINLKFSKNDISSGVIKLNFKHKKEFSFNGNMYDIKNVNETKDSVFYLCFHDKREDELNKSLKSNQNHQKSNNYVSIEKLLSLLSANYINVKISDIQFSKLIRSDVSFSKDNLLMVFLDNPYPPPKLIL